MSCGIARHYRPTPIYEALLEQDGVRLREKVTLADSLNGISLRQVPLGHRQYAMFAPSTGLAALLETLSQNTRQEVFPVVENGRLVGIITLEDLLVVASQRQLEALVNAADVMRAPISLHQDENLRVAFESMLAQGVRELPATDDGGRIISFVDETSIAHAYMAARNKAR